MSRPLILSDDPDLLDDLLRLAAVADVEVRIETEVTAVRAAWREASGVLVGADQAASVVRLALPRRDGVVVVARAAPDVHVWADAVALGASHVLSLPDEEHDVVGLLRTAARGAAPDSPLVGFMGGTGGAGASTLSVAFAQAAVAAGRDTLLVDADGYAGGLDFLMGAELLAGARWPELAERAAVGAGSGLIEGLPRLDRLCFLSFARGGPATLAPSLVLEVLGEAGRRHDLVCVDLPRRFDPGTLSALGAVDVLLLVVRPLARAVAASARLLEELASHGVDIRIVVRGPAPGGLRPTDVADVLGWPVVGSLKAQGDLDRSVEEGVSPGMGPRSSLSRLCRRLVPELIGGAERSRRVGSAA